MTEDIERELEQTLHRVIDPIAARPIPPRRAMHSRSAFRTVTGGAGAALTVKLLTGIAAAAAAVTVAGTVTTGSINPVAWGQTVTQQVQTCKDKLADGQHGIGDCVSDLASTHGAAVASAARHHGNPNSNGNNGNGNGNGNAGGNGNGNGQSGGVHGRSSSHPTPPPKSGSS